jgi:RNA polymerase-binding transcription factor DksA
MAAKSPTKKAAAPAKQVAAAKSTASKTKAAASAPTAKAGSKATKATKQPAGKAATKPAAKPSSSARPATNKATASTTGAKAVKSTAAATEKKAAPAKTAAATEKKAAPAKPATAASKPSRPAASTPANPPNTRPAPDTMHELPKPKFNKEGLGYTKDFDLAFIKAQYDLLQQERIHLTGQAKRLEDEAHQLVEEAEMGDVQFDDEGGEGDTMVVERERDLALSAQARDAVAEIDAAITRIMDGTYGYSVVSGKPIPKERLEAIPWSSVLVEEKVGGIGRR